jgi:pimeloyl-ACP methyl ester carboxylesterase
MNYEDVWITCKDKVKIHAWFVKANAAPKMCRTLIFFHGNAGNIGARNPNIELLVKRLNTNVLIIDYRGYGKSEGAPSEDGLKLDADATLEYALNCEDINSERIFLFGRSLGGAVAIQLAMAKSNSLKGLVVENTFTSIAELVDTIMPMVAPFKVFIQRVFYPSIDRIG